MGGQQAGPAQMMGGAMMGGAMSGGMGGQGMPLLSVDPGVTDSEYDSWFTSSPAGTWKNGNPDTVRSAVCFHVCVCERFTEKDAPKLCNPDTVTGKDAPRLCTDFGRLHLLFPLDHMALFSLVATHQRR